MCTSHDQAEALFELGDSLDGWYYLIHNDSQWGHSFVTHEGKRAAAEAFVAASAHPDANHPFEWNEEWELRRIDDGSSDERHFEILAISQVFTQGSAVTAMLSVLERGRAKFHRRWADDHILVLESRAPVVNAENLSAVIDEVGSEDLRGLDTILLVDGEELHSIWQRER